MNFEMVAAPTFRLPPSFISRDKLVVFPKIQDRNFDVY